MIKDAVHAASVPDRQLPVDWVLLPGPCRLAVVRFMDCQERAAWRQLSRQACQDVWDATSSLIWQYCSQRLISPHYRLPDLARKCPGRQRLLCVLSHLCSLQGLPPSLQVLNLTRCAMIQDFQPIRQCTALRELILGANAYWPSAAAQLLQHLTTLRVLRFRDCMQKQDTAAAVAPCTGALKHLHVLELATRTAHVMKPETATALAAALAKLQLLEALDLSWQRMGPANAVILAPAIGGLSRLTNLHLTGCYIGAQGAAALAPALAGLQQLAVLHLQASWRFYDDEEEED